jgi:hypothetical protein
MRALLVFACGDWPGVALARTLDGVVTPPAGDGDGSIGVGQLIGTFSSSDVRTGATTGAPPAWRLATGCDITRVCAGVSLAVSVGCSWLVVQRRIASRCSRSQPDEATSEERRGEWLVECRR